MIINLIIYYCGGVGPLDRFSTLFFINYYFFLFAHTLYIRSFSLHGTPRLMMKVWALRLSVEIDDVNDKSLRADCKKDPDVFTECTVHLSSMNVTGTDYYVQGMTHV